MGSVFSSCFNGGATFSSCFIGKHEDFSRSVSVGNLMNRLEISFPACTCSSDEGVEGGVRGAGGRGEGGGVGWGVTEDVWYVR